MGNIVLFPNINNLLGSYNIFAISLGNNIYSVVAIGLFQWDGCYIRPPLLGVHYPIVIWQFLLLGLALILELSNDMFHKLLTFTFAARCLQTPCDGCHKNDTLLVSYWYKSAYVC